MNALCRAWCAGLMLAAAAPIWATPWSPTSDDEVIEVLPSGLVPRSAVQRAQRSPESASALARTWIEQARASGDPRPAGQALALLKPFAEARDAAPAAVLMMATAEQYLHEFEPAARRLQALLARDPSQAQAWLTLATVRRVQGRYADSDIACRALLGLRAVLHGEACLAENLALRGERDAARTRLQRLLAAQGDAGTRAWLLTTLAELEERAGQSDVAERSYRESLAAAPDGYTRLALADLLLRQGRPAEAAAELAGEPRSDAVLLRLALAGQRTAASELRERFAQADLRPGAAAVHARERAMFALGVDHDARAALAYARRDVQLQREPLDLLVFAGAARASGRAEAQAELQRLIDEVGLHDNRIDPRP